MSCASAYERAVATGLTECVVNLQQRRDCHPDRVLFGGGGHRGLVGVPPEPTVGTCAMLWPLIEARSAHDCAFSAAQNHDCNTPAYILNGVNYWSLGNSQANTDKVVACQD